MSLHNYKPKTAPALWMTTRAGKAAIAAAAKAKALKAAARLAAKRAQPRKRIAPVSRRERERLKEYAKAKAAHLAEFPNCQVCGPLVQVVTGDSALKYAAPHPANQIHHLRGRLGPLLTDRKWFRSACQQGHTFIGDNPDIARKAGVLAEVGEWGRPT